MRLRMMLALLAGAVTFMSVPAEAHYQGNYYGRYSYQPYYYQPYRSYSYRSYQPRYYSYGFSGHRYYQPRFGSYQWWVDNDWFSSRRR